MYVVHIDSKTQVGYGISLLVSSSSNDHSTSTELNDYYTYHSNLKVLGYLDITWLKHLLKEILEVDLLSPLEFCFGTPKKLAIVSSLCLTKW